MRLNILSVLIPGLLLCSCVSIPITTMIKMSRYEIEDYLNIEPGDVRMRITSDSDDPLVLEKTTLKIQITEKDGTKTDLGGFLIMESEQDLTPARGLFSFGYQPEHVYVLKFDEQAVDSFRQVSRILMKRLKERREQEKLGIRDERKGSLTIGAAYDFRDRKKAGLIVEIMLHKKDGYFTLLNKVDFPPEMEH